MVIYSESVVENTAGQTVLADYTGGSVTYGYDRTGRLQRSQRTTDNGGCIATACTFDTRTGEPLNAVDYRSMIGPTCARTGHRAKGGCDVFDTDL